MQRCSHEWLVDNLGQKGASIGDGKNREQQRTEESRLLGIVTGAFEHRSSLKAAVTTCSFAVVMQE